MDVTYYVAKNFNNLVLLKELQIAVVKLFRDYRHFLQGLGCISSWGLELLALA